MNKQDALDKIEELKAFVEGCDKVNKNVITRSKRFSHDEDYEWHINDGLAFFLLKGESDYVSHAGSESSGHMGSIYLSDIDGRWFNEDGEVVHGYLFYKPCGEE